MEPAGPGVALEREEVRTLIRLICIGGGVAMAPPLALGHGVEFLLARLEVLPGKVRVEVTADCEGNMMLPDKEAAKEAMARLFEVGREGSGTRVRWDKLARLRFEDRTILDETAPLPPDPTWAVRDHALVTGVWEWVPETEERFQLAVPKGEMLDTLMWCVESEGNRGRAVKWKMLISGDETEWMGPVMVKSEWWRSWWWGVLIVLFGGAGMTKRRALA
jgi:hypothetical protein